jgi:hypothetical protein
VLLIGRTESGLTIEPITSALVICQLLAAPLFAWFLELRSVAKQSARPIPPALFAKHQHFACNGTDRHWALIAFSHPQAPRFTGSVERSLTNAKQVESELATT